MSDIAKNDKNYISIGIWLILRWSIRKNELERLLADFRVWEYPMRKLDIVIIRKVKIDQLFLFLKVFLIYSRQKEKEKSSRAGETRPVILQVLNLAR